MNNLNPKFVKTFDIIWQFEIRQDLEIHVCVSWRLPSLTSCSTVNKHG